MNEFKVRYIKDGVPTYVDFMSSEDKTFIVTDKDETMIVDAFKVDTFNRLKFLEYVNKSKISWIYTAEWSEDPSDIWASEVLYKFHILETTNTDVIYDTTTMPDIINPDRVYIDSNGDIITIPGETIPGSSFQTLKSFGDMYSSALAESIYFGHLGLPEYYVGLGVPSGQLFNSI